MSLFTDEQKRRVNDYFPSLGNRPPGMGTGGLLGLIERMFSSTDNGKGASQIGIEDSGSLITAETVEGALAENRTAIDAVEADVVNLETFQGTDDITAAGTGVTAGVGTAAARTVVFSFTDVDVALTDETGVIAYGGLKFADFDSEGVVCILGAVADLALTKSSAGVNDDWDGDFSVGSATAGNDADLTSTEADVIPKTATPQAAAGATTATGHSTGTECPAYLDGTSTAKDLFVNFLVDDADHDVGSTACNLILNGTITVTYALLGDY